MNCPECGAEAGAANFCPECGTDLRDAAADLDCSACGAEVPEGAKFCPECGEPTGAAKRPRAAAPAGPASAKASSGGGRRTGTRGRSAGTGQQRQQRRQQPRGGKAQSTRQPGRVSPAIAWGVLGAVVVVAVVVVVLFARSAGGDAGSASGTTPTGSGSVQAVAADTSGSYDQLVQRANGLYDQGATKFQAKQYEQGAQYFLAASKVYAAAWQQRATDPSVGTDYATSLFYSGDIDGAIAQVDKVLAKSPDFQTAWFNKGNYFAERARQSKQDGNTKAADRDYAQARIAYQKAVDLDPQSSSGQQAKQSLSELPQ